MGIRVELVGQIENCIDKSLTYQFLCLGTDLEPPGSLSDNISYDFSFPRAVLPYETYAGIAARLRYFINVVINRSYGGSVTREEDFIVQNAIRKEELEENTPFRMELYLENILHLEV